MIFLNMELRKLATFYSLVYLSLDFHLIYGQTPPNYTPSTLNTLNVTFNGNLSIYPGQSLQPAGMMTFLWEGDTFPGLQEKVLIPRR